MVRSLNMIRFFRPLVGLLLITLLFSACKKNDNPYSNSPVTGLMAFNLAPDKQAVGYSLSGNNLASVLGYTDYTAVYLPIFPGTREVRTFDHFSGSTIAISSANFSNGLYYSAFLLGSNGNYRNLVVEDKLDTLTPAAGKAWVRFINAIPDSTVAPSVTVAGDNAVSAPYGTVSEFKQVNAGAVNSSISNGSTISASRSINMEENKVYTLLFVGLPNPTDSSQALQVRFIVNGVVTQ